MAAPAASNSGVRSRNPSPSSVQPGGVRLEIPPDHGPLPQQVSACDSLAAVVDGVEVRELSSLLEQWITLLPVRLAKLLRRPHPYTPRPWTSSTTSASPPGRSTPARDPTPRPAPGRCPSTPPRRCLRGRPARRRPVRPAELGQHLHQNRQPDQRRLRGEDGLAGGRPRCGGHRLGAGGAAHRYPDDRSRRATTSWRPATSTEGPIRSST